MSDLSLTSAVMQALADNRLVHPDEISLDVRDGEVTMRGTVGTIVQREEAARTARAVPGVRHVEDQLSVRPMGIDGETDADTEAAVLDALVADDEQQASDIEVRSRAGTVTLRGLVDDLAQRDRVERLVLGVPGVSHVRNELEAGR